MAKLQPFDLAQTRAMIKFRWPPAGGKELLINRRWKRSAASPAAFAISANWSMRRYCTRPRRISHVNDDKIVAMALRSNYHLVLNHKTNGPTYHQVDPLYAHGSDGSRTLTCITHSVIFFPKHIVRQHLSTMHFSHPEAKITQLALRADEFVVPVVN